MGLLGIPDCTIRWVKSLLSDRRAQVRWGATLSDSRVFQEGLPQGSVLAPILWLCYVNDIDDGMPQEVLRSLYEDDAALLSTGRSIDECCTKLQTCLNRVDEWLSWWKVAHSINKCCTTPFTLDPKESNRRARPCLSMRRQALPVDSSPTFLGIKLDGHQYCP